MKAFTWRLKHVLWKAWSFLTLSQYFQVHYTISEPELKSNINPLCFKSLVNKKVDLCGLAPPPPSLRPCTPLCITSVYFTLFFSSRIIYTLLYSALPYIPCSMHSTLLYPNLLYSTLLPSTLLYPNLRNSRLSLLRRSTLQFPTLLDISLFNLPEEHIRF